MSLTLIVVIGMHRSGTSMCSNMLHMLGADMAESPHAAPANMKGHWERPRLVDMNDAIFGFFRRPWGSPSHVLDMPRGWLDDPRVGEMHDHACAWLQPRLQPDHPFGFKDPRTTLLLPFWQRVFAAIGAAPRYVFCVRDPAQVARSLLARDSMERGQAEYRWLRYNIEAVRAMYALPVCVVPYEHWFDRPAETVSRLADHVGLPRPSDDRMRQVIDAELRHDVDIPPAASLARRLHRAIVANAEHTAIDAPLRELVVLLGEMKEQFQPLLIDAEVVRGGSLEQRRVIGDLQALVRQLRENASASPGEV